MADAMAFATGQVILLDGLKNKPSLNGLRGVVRRFLPENRRWEVDTARGNVRTLSLKQANMLPVSTSGVWDALEVWPRPVNEVSAATHIPVTPVEDWPTDWTQEVAYLKARGWQDPQLFGFASGDAKKPDFQLYYDASDMASAVNVLGNRIVAGTPGYKLPSGGIQSIHGKFIVVYSPTTMGGEFSIEYTPHGPMGTRWSVERVQQVLHFFNDTAAAARKLQQMSGWQAMMGM